MRRLVLGILVIPLFLVGCGTARKLETIRTNQSPWVAFWQEHKPNIYYKLTADKVQGVGSVIQDISTFPNASSSAGLSGWESNIKDRKIEIRALSGVSVKKEVAVRYSKNGPYYKAIAQSKKP